MKSDLVGQGGTQPIGDVLEALPLSSQHPDRLPGEQSLCLSLCVKQSKPPFGHWKAQLFQLQPAHCNSSPEDETAQLLVDLISEDGWQGEDLGSVPDC